VFLVGVGSRVHSHRFDAKFVAGALYTQRDFTAVCYENFFQHGLFTLIRQ
jgi:hypothetical protein